jgi:hypothetical protein
MPLTEKGEKVLRNFKEEYGEEEGEKIFYAWLNKKSERRRKKYEEINKESN